VNQLDPAAPPADRSGRLEPRQRARNVRPRAAEWSAALGPSVSIDTERASRR
jgi:hypothetical protein